MAIWDVTKEAWSAFRKVQELLEIQTRTRDAIASLDNRLRALEDRMTHLEAAQGQIVTEAKAAAGVAATGLAGSVIAEIVTRVTRIEMRQEDIQKRLSP